MSIYQIECVVQTFMVILVVSVYFVVMRYHKGKISNSLCITLGYSIFVNLGYLLELTAHNIDSAMMGIRVNYCGAAFVSTSIMLFIFEYCRVKFPNYIKVPLFIWNFIIFISLWTYESNPYFYRDIKYIVHEDSYYLTHGVGPLYIINVVILANQMIASAVCTFVTYKKSIDPKYKEHCKILFIAMLVPITGFVLGKSKLFGEFDIIPAAQSLTAFVMSIAVVYGRIFDSQRIGHEHVFSNIAEPAIIWDLNNKLIDANPKARELFPVFTNLHEMDDMPEGMIRHMTDGGVNEFVYNERTYSAEKQEIRVDNELQGYAIIFFDLTHEREQLEEMKQLKRDADIANSAKSEFLMKMSHEIRTPINAISGMNEMILRESTEPEIKKYAEDIKGASVMLLDIINEILDSSKIESGKMNIVPVDYSMGKLLYDLNNICRIKAEEKGLRLCFDIDRRIPDGYLGDDVRIKQILVNMIGNSIKYTQRGSVTVKLTGVRNNDVETLHFEVIDTGIGIKEDDKAKLFERFQRVDEERNRNVEGTGLGMYITLQLLHLMGSELKVESEYNKGSTFYFDLDQPVISETAIGNYEEKMEAAIALSEQEDVFIAPDASILVVDDNKVNLRVMGGLLKRTRAKITLVSSGRECLDVLKEQSYDIVFLDHMMPDMDGIETLNEIKKQKLCENTPVVALTANAITGARETYLELGFDDFLSKPIRMAEMEELLKTYIFSE